MFFYAIVQYFENKLGKIETINKNIFLNNK